MGSARARIRVASADRRESGTTRVTVLAHSCSEHMVIEYIDAGGRDFDAFMGIGMGATDYGKPMRAPMPLDKLTVPVLDVRGGEDFSAVHRFAPRRAASMARGGNASSKQIKVDGANHYFDDRADALHEVTITWLNALEK